MQCSVNTYHMFEFELIIRKATRSIVRSQEQRKAKRCRMDMNLRRRVSIRRSNSLLGLCYVARLAHILPAWGINMKRTVLYYPTISIPNGAWLRRALFYFDEIASIVPSTLYFSGELGPALVVVSDEVLFLESEGVFRRMTPDNLWLINRNTETVADWQPAHAFQHEFLRRWTSWASQR